MVEADRRLKEVFELRFRAEAAERERDAALERQAKLEAALREWMKARLEVREAQRYIGKETPSTSPFVTRAGRTYMRLGKAESDLEIMAGSLLVQPATEERSEEDAPDPEDPWGIPPARRR